MEASLRTMGLNTVMKNNNNNNGGDNGHDSAAKASHDTSVIKNEAMKKESAAETANKVCEKEPWQKLH